MNAREERIKLMIFDYRSWLLVNGKPTDDWNRRTSSPRDIIIRQMGLKIAQWFKSQLDNPRPELLP